MNSDVGVYLYISGTENVLSANYCDDNGHYGIYLYSSNRTAIKDNLCRTNGYYGIYLNSSSLSTVKGNTCNDNGDTGILLYRECDNNTVQANTCNGNTGKGIHVLQACAHNTIQGNTCTGDGEGISVDATSLGNSVSANVVTSSSDNYDWVWFVAGAAIFLAVLVGAVFLSLRKKRKAAARKKRKSGR